MVREEWPYLEGPLWGPVMQSPCHHVQELQGCALCGICGLSCCGWAVTVTVVGILLGMAGCWPPSWLSVRLGYSCCRCACVQGRSLVWVAVGLGLHCVGAGPSILFWTYSGATHQVLGCEPLLWKPCRAAPWCWGRGCCFWGMLGPPTRNPFF